MISHLIDRKNTYTKITISLKIRKTNHSKTSHLCQKKTKALPIQDSRISRAGKKSVSIKNKILYLFVDVDGLKVSGLSRSGRNRYLLASNKFIDGGTLSNVRISNHSNDKRPLYSVFRYMSHGFEQLYKLCWRVEIQWLICRRRWRNFLHSFLISFENYRQFIQSRPVNNKNN